MRRRTLLGTRNAAKVSEIRAIAAPFSAVELIAVDEVIQPSLAEQSLEVFATFTENALAKARYFAQNTDLAVLAEDSGLCVDGLGGAPGVRSKRFSARGDLDGADLDGLNNDLLLGRLLHVGHDGRSAHYVCVAAVVFPDGAEATFEGTCDGVILDRPSGSGGFGYDPLFLVPREGTTFAELPASRKNEISHRAIAIRQALQCLAFRG